MKKILLTVLFIGILGIGNCVCAKSLEEYTIEITDLNYAQKHQEALKLANIAISGYPNSAVLYCLRGGVYEDLNNKKAALADYDKAISLDPKNEDAYFYRGMIKLDLGSAQSAYTDFTTCLRVSPKNGYCYTGRGTARMELGDLSGSMKDMEYGLQLIDEDAKQSAKELDQLLKETDEMIEKAKQETAK